MSVKKLRDGKAGIFICAFLIPFLMMQIFWAICGIYPFGDNSILTGDMDIEFVNFYAYFINTLKTNNDWSYMLTKTLGGDFPGLAAFQLHDPLLFILLLFPKDNIATGIEFLFTLQVSIAGLSASVLLNNRYKRSWMSLVFSTGYAFCSFFFGYLVLTIYFGALAILPLVIYFFLTYLDDESRFIPFIITASLYIYINYHMGFMLVIFLVIVYVSKIISDTKYLKRFFGLFVSGVTILLINGFFLVRIGLSLIGEKTTEGADYGIYRRFPLNSLFSGMFSGAARNDLRPLIYCSVAALFFAVVYFASSAIPLRKKIADAFIIAAVSVSMWINALDAVWHGFNNPEGFYWRYAYYISITVVVLGYKGFILMFDDTQSKPAAKPLKPVIISTLIIVLYMIWLLIMNDAYLDKIRFVINILLVVVITVISVLAIRREILRTAGFTLLVVISIAEMLYNAKTSYLSLNILDGEAPKMSAFKEDYHYIDNVISAIKSYDDGFYRTEKDFDRAINDPSMFDYIGLSHDSSCEKDAILDWLVNFGFCKTVYFTYYNGGSTSFVDNLFGVKYYVSRFDTVEKPYEKIPFDGKYYAYKNPNALPMAYIAPDGYADHDLSEGNTFEKQNMLASYWTDRPVFIKAQPKVSVIGATDDGNGRYVKTEDEAYVVYTINVSEQMPLYYYFYAPQRQNAEVFVNGESHDVYFTVNHWNTLCAGTYSPGDTLEIKLQILDDELTVSEACFYYEDPDALSEWGAVASSLNAPIGEIEKISSSDLVFDTDSQEDTTVVVSIPYEDSWEIMCDGNKLAGRKALDMLICFDVPSGQHTIEMRYTPNGTGVGLLLSIAGLIIFLTRILAPKFRSYQQSRK